MDGITDAEFEALYAQSAKADPVYNLVEDATEECLTGDCEHFCGEPTEDDKDRRGRRTINRFCAPAQFVSSFTLNRSPDRNVRS
jgi:hypothetical protein